MVAASRRATAAFCRSRTALTTFVRRCRSREWLRLYQGQRKRHRATLALARRTLALRDDLLTHREFEERELMNAMVAAVSLGTYALWSLGCRSE